MDYLSEALRWWDHWLKGRDTGIMNEPMLRVWMQYESAKPGKAEVPGYWAAEDAWPSTRIEERVYFLNGGSALGASCRRRGTVRLDPIQTVGVDGGKWCPSGAGGGEDLDLELPFDQRIDDARSLTFDSPPLEEAFEMLGAPTLTLELAVDKPVAFLAARLNEVRPTGRIEPRHLWRFEPLPSRERRGAHRFGAGRTLYREARARPHRASLQGW